MAPILLMVQAIRTVRATQMVGATPTGLVTRTDLVTPMDPATPTAPMVLPARLMEAVTRCLASLSPLFMDLHPRRMISFAS
jgi:hypothetical protein